MSNQQTVLTTLGCAGSLAVILAMTSPAMASSVTVDSVAASSATAADSLNYGLPTLVQNESKPIRDALGCTCARCMMASQQSIL